LIAGFSASRTPAGDAVVREALEHLRAARAREVDPQVERRRVQQSLREAHRLVGAALAGKALPEPVGQFSAHGIGPFFGARAAHSLEELGLYPLAERAAGKAHYPCERRREQLAGLGAARRRLERTAPPQHGEGRFGDEGALALPELAVSAEVARQHLVGGPGEAQELVQRRLGMADKRGAEPHREMRVAICS
jgi:hypothetical protein